MEVHALVRCILLRCTVLRFTASMPGDSNSPVQLQAGRQATVAATILFLSAVLPVAADVTHVHLRVDDVTSPEARRRGTARACSVLDGARTALPTVSGAGVQWVGVGGGVNRHGYEHTRAEALSCVFGVQGAGVGTCRSPDLVRHSCGRDRSTALCCSRGCRPRQHHRQCRLAAAAVDCAYLYHRGTR